MSYVHCFIAGMCLIVVIDCVRDQEAGSAVMGTLFMLANLFLAAANA